MLGSSLCQPGGFSTNPKARWESGPLGLVLLHTAQGEAITREAARSKGCFRRSFALSPKCVQQCVAGQRAAATWLTEVFSRDMAASRLAPEMVDGGVDGRVVAAERLVRGGGGGGGGGREQVLNEGAGAAAEAPQVHVDVEFSHY